MALAVRTERAGRAAVVRSRVHGGAQERTMVKTTASVAHVTRRPQLIVVAPQRRTARWIVAGSTLVFALMLGAAAFQTQLARRQLELDSIDRRIRAAHEQYDVLRRERAELRSPGRLATEAAALGMVSASQTKFVQLDPAVVAEVQRAGVPQGNGHDVSVEQEFADYARVKAQAGGAP